MYVACIYTFVPRSDTGRLTSPSLLSLALSILGVNAVMLGRFLQDLHKLR